MLERAFFENCLLVFEALVQTVLNDHAFARATLLDLVAHDEVHVFTVATYAAQIAAGERYDHQVIQACWAAGLCHNVDRLFPADRENQVRAALERYQHVLPREFLLFWDALRDAVLDHAGPNDPKKTNGILTVLQDADRVANMGLPAALRCAQYYNTLPTFHPRFVFEKDPTANYKNPKTVLRDAFAPLEWFPGKYQDPRFVIQTKTGVELARPYYEWLLRGFELTQRQVDESQILAVYVRAFPNILGS